MDTMIDRIVAAAGRYEGRGSGVESGDFTAVLEIAPLLDGLGAAIDYAAVAPDGTELHREHTVVAFDMWSGEATLYVLCAELQGMAHLSQIGEGVFGNGRGLDGFEVQIELILTDDTVQYRWSWGAPGEALAERSRATMTVV